jgi:phospholipase/lecithinase/hemolysin
VYFHFCFIIYVFLVRRGAATEEKNPHGALFVFGDSIVDPGNNNYISTIPENRADYEPHGQNGFFGGPTGRFSNGRIIVDFIAEYANLPLIPPYLDPKTDDYTNGVNFASGGSGVLPETNQGLAIDFPTQLKYFHKVQDSLIEKFGDQTTRKIISEAVYFISIGSNDYMAGYLGNPKMQELYNPEAYIGMVIGNLSQTVQVLYEKGARKFGFLSLSPLGCLPALRVLNPANDGDCFQAANALAKAHNMALRNVLSSFEQFLEGFIFCNSDFYDWLDDRVKNYSKYGFKEGVNACCGTGPYRGIPTCGGTKKEKKYELCENAEDYLWWDSFHASEKIHHQVAQDLWNGQPSFSVGPYNLHDLFFGVRAPITIADVVDAPSAQSYQ